MEFCPESNAVKNEVVSHSQTYLHSAVSVLQKGPAPHIIILV